MLYGTRQDPEAKRQAVIIAATEVFLRYGYTRTTMAELASGAEVSRPSLYGLFPSKEKLFAAAARKLGQDTLQGYRSELPKLKGVKRQLHRFCGDWVVHSFELVERHPHAKDLFDLAMPAVREVYEDFAAFLAELLSEPAQRKVLKATPQAIARNLVYSLRGLREAATDAEDMRRLTTLQVEIVAAALEA